MGVSGGVLPHDPGPRRQPRPGGLQRQLGDAHPGGVRQHAHVRPGRRVRRLHQHQEQAQHDAADGGRLINYLVDIIN